MFNYTKETIINDIANVSVNDKILSVKRCGNYDMDKIVDKKIHKTEGEVGSLASITIDPAKFTTDGTVDYRQFAIFVKSPTQSFAEFAMSDWKEFGKPILIESAAQDADKLVEAFKLAEPLESFFSVEKSESNKVKITFKESWMAVDKVEIFEHIIASDKMVYISDTADLVTISPNKVEFATARWLTENLRLPSLPNVRYTHLYADESPIYGKLYTQYAFEYLVERTAPGGMSGVGQKVDSITTHVFYVLSEKATEFEGKIGDKVTFEEDKD